MTPALTWHQLAARLHRRDAAFDGGHVAWRGLGEGPPLVLLHGGHGSWAHWCRNIEAWSAHFSVWVADMPGYGDSAPPPAATLDALVEALQQSLAALLGPRVPIWLGGFSFGGLVAAHLAARRGAVRALALLGAAGHGGARRPRGELFAWREVWERGDAAALRAIMKTNLERHMLAGPAGDEAVDLHTEACVRTRFTSKRMSLAGGLQDVLASLACPLWMAWGEHDVTATPERLVPALAARFGQAVVQTLPGAGHWVPYEAADRLNPLLLDWLRAQDGARP